MTRKSKTPKGKAPGPTKAKGRGKAARTPAKTPAKSKDKIGVKTAAPKPKAAARKAEPQPKPAPKPKPVYAHVFDNPLNVKRLIYALYAVCGVSVLLDLVVHRHVDHPWEALFGFYAVYGLVGFTLLVFAAKELRKILMRREDYYDD